MRRRTEAVQLGLVEKVGHLEARVGSGFLTDYAMYHNPWRNYLFLSVKLG